MELVHRPSPLLLWLLKGPPVRSQQLLNLHQTYLLRHQQGNLVVEPGFGQVIIILLEAHLENQVLEMDLGRPQVVMGMVETIPIPLD
jgi:hypothetical protein